MRGLGKINLSLKIFPGGHGVAVDSTSADQFVYQSTKIIKVSGSGFDHVKTEEGFGPPKFRWFSGIKGRGQNYMDEAEQALGLKASKD